MSSVAKLGDGTFAFFIRDSRVSELTVWIMNPANPGVLEGPIATYTYSNMTHGTVLLDTVTQTWFLYYRNEDSSAYGARTAPAMTN